IPRASDSPPRQGSAAAALPYGTWLLAVAVAAVLVAGAVTLAVRLVMLEPADTLALVPEARRAEGLPAAVLALALCGRAARCRRGLLELAVDHDLAQVGGALDVDQHVGRRHRAGRERMRIVPGRDRRRVEGVGRRAVRVDGRRHVVAAEEPRRARRAVRRHDVEPRRAALALARARECERSGHEGLAAH